MGSNKPPPSYTLYSLADFQGLIRMHSLNILSISSFKVMLLDLKILSYQKKKKILSYHISLDV